MTSRRWLLILSLLALLASCGTQPTATATANPPTTASPAEVSTTEAPTTTVAPTTTRAESPLTAEPGATIDAVEGDVVDVPWASLSITILEVDDSRCPASEEVQCVWEGEFAVQLRFTPDDGDSEVRRIVGILDQGFKIYGDQPSTSFEDVVVTNVGVADSGTISLLFDALA